MGGGDLRCATNLLRLRPVLSACRAQHPSADAPRRTARLRPSSPDAGHVEGRRPLGRNEAPPHDRPRAHQMSRASAARRADDGSRPSDARNICGPPVPAQKSRDDRLRAHDALYWTEAEQLLRTAYVVIDQGRIMAQGSPAQLDSRAHRVARSRVRSAADQHIGSDGGGADLGDSVRPRMEVAALRPLASIYSRDWRRPTFVALTERGLNPITSSPCVCSSLEDVPALTAGACDRGNNEPQKKPTRQRTVDWK